MIRPLIVAGCALSLAGCVGMSRSSTVTPMAAADTASGLRVTEITLTKGDDLKLTPEFDGIFKSHVQKKLDACATGARPVRLEASLQRFDKANPVLTAVIVGSNVLRGEARLVDAASGAVIADYKVGKTIVGGRFAVVVMAEAEEQMSDAFGDELCKQAFKPVETTK